MTRLILTQVVIHQLYPAEKIGSPPFENLPIQLFQVCAWGQKWPRPGRHTLYIGL